MKARMLHRKLDSLVRIARQRGQHNQEPTYQCYWGNEDIPHEPGAIIINTKWGTSKLELEEREVRPA